MSKKNKSSEKNDKKVEKRESAKKRREIKIDRDNVNSGLDEGFVYYEE